MDKKKLFLEIIIIVGIMIYGIVKGELSLKNSIGSSDNPLTMVGEIDDLLVLSTNNIEAGITTSDNKIKSVLFLNENSSILYNKNIEKKDINTGINKILTTIDKVKKIKEIEVTYYKGDLRIKDILTNFCTSNSCIYKETKSSIKDLVNKYDIDYTNDEEAVRKLNYYSKELMREHKQKNNSITTDNYKEQTDYVYNKLLLHIQKNNITNEEQGHNSIEIFLIPTSSSIDNYPTTNSYYYVKDGKVYAYIEINVEDKLYSYCYNGSIDNYNSGMCK
ncbi:MAG: hypothetical protein IJI43_01580 [Bacilli bacterium]|nr:hypothetical protein [Bacilli bacterium]